LKFLPISPSTPKIDYLVRYTRELKGAEGFVVRFDDGEMVKIKADEYCLFHRAKESLEREKCVVEMIVKGTLDDFKPLLMPIDLERLERFEKEWGQGIVNASGNHIWYEIDRIQDNGLSRKDFALTSTLSNVEKSIVFNYFDKLNYLRMNLYTVLLQYIKENATSSSKIDKIRHLWNNIRWEDYYFSTMKD
jgi:hypothetical protein